MMFLHLGSVNLTPTLINVFTDILNLRGSLPLITLCRAV